VLVAWQDGRGGTDHIRVNRSTNGGRTFAVADVAPDALARSSTPSGPATMPALAVDVDGRAYVAWEDRRSGERDIYLACSPDGGVTWQPPSRVDSDPPGRGISYHPQIVAFSRGRVLVCWWDERDGLADVYVRRSTDGGASWTGPEIRLDPGPPARTPSHEVRVETRRRSVTLLWVEGRDPPPSGPLRTLASRTSTDRGRTWGAVRSVARPAESRTEAASPRGESLAVDVEGGALRVQWRPHP
jgi:hypothetical protein